MPYIILTPQQHIVASIQRTHLQANVQAMGILTADGNYALPASLLQLPEHANHLAQFSHLPQVETFEPALSEPALEVMPPNLGGFRLSVLANPIFRRIVADYAVIDQAALATAINATDPYYPAVALI